MHAIIAGTRHEKGIDALLIDRTDVPHDIPISIMSTDKDQMKRWVQGIYSGKGFKRIKLLGPKADLGGTNWTSSFKQLIKRIINILRYIICRILMKLFRNRRNKPGNCIWTEDYNGQTIIKIGSGLSALSLSMKLAKNQYISLLFGVDDPVRYSSLRGTLRVSQKRGDGEISPGYEIRKES